MPFGVKSASSGTSAAISPSTVEVGAGDAGANQPRPDPHSNDRPGDPNSILAEILQGPRSKRQRPLQAECYTGRSAAAGRFGHDRRRCPTTRTAAIPTMSRPAAVSRYHPMFGPQPSDSDRLPEGWIPHAVGEGPHEPQNPKEPMQEMPPYWQSCAMADGCSVATPTPVPTARAPAIASAATAASQSFLRE